MADVVVGDKSYKKTSILNNKHYRLLLLFILILVAVLLMCLYIVFFRSRDVNDSKQYRTDLSYTELSNRVNSYGLNNNHDDAIMLIKSQKKIDINSKNQLLASVYTNNNNIKKAIEYYKELYRSQNMTQGDAYSAATLAYNNNDIGSAKIYLDRAIQLALKNTTSPVSTAEAARYKMLLAKINNGESVKL